MPSQPSLTAFLACPCCFNPRWSGDITGSFLFLNVIPRIAFALYIFRIVNARSGTADTLRAFINCPDMQRTEFSRTAIRLGCGGDTWHALRCTGSGAEGPTDLKCGTYGELLRCVGEDMWGRSLGAHRRGPSSWQPRTAIHPKCSPARPATPIGRLSCPWAAARPKSLAGDSRMHTRRLQEPPTLENSTLRSTPSSPARKQYIAALAQLRG